MNGRPEFQPTRVPFAAKQVGEAEARWVWAEPCVWTDRMLTALETGVKGGQWFSLIRWPNVYFAGRGLFSLKHAHASACQSSLREHYRPESRMRENRTSGSEGGES